MELLIDAIHVGLVFLKLIIYGSGCLMGLSSADNIRSCNFTFVSAPGDHRVPESQTQSTDTESSQYKSYPLNHSRITYNRTGLYICRVCNVVGCTEKNVTVSVLGRLFRIEL